MGYQEPNQTPQQPGGYPPPPPPQNTDQYKNKAIAAMVLGIVSIILTFILSGTVPFATLISLVLSIVALVLAVPVRKAIPKGAPNRGMATAGFVLAIISLAVWALTFIIVLAAVGCAVGLLASM